MDLNRSAASKNNVPRRKNMIDFDTLKNAADYIAENCEDDGVAKTIRKFCF